MTRLGYARVSSAGQDTALQIQDLEAAGCECIYRDHGISGTRTSRPELDKMLDRLSRGDELVVWKLDRPGQHAPPARAARWLQGPRHQVPLAARRHRR